MKGIADFCEKFAKDRKLFCVRDECNNVIIKKPAYKGYEDKEPVLLQAHLDMVCEKSEGIDFDFETEGIKLIEKDGFISADGTTLGADNGIGVAIILAALDEDIPTPAIEGILTTDEEVGMLGAMGLNGSLITGKKMINLDSEGFGVFTVSCAGGVDVTITVPAEKVLCTGKRFEISVVGLPGGHSGAEIGKYVPNANIIMGRILSHLDDLGFISLSGGEKRNVIPSSSKAVIVTKEDITKKVSDVYEKLYELYRCTDFRIECKMLDEGEFEAFKVTAAQLLLSIPNGVFDMSRDIEGLVLSSANCGIMNLSEDGFKLGSLVRSSSDFEKRYVADKFRFIAETFGGSAKESGQYPGWQFNPDSELLKFMKEEYEKLFSQKPIIEAIHMGVECGIFAEKINGFECVSIGPDTYDIHTPLERVSKESIEKLWTFVKKLLKDWRY